MRPLVLLLVVSLFPLAAGCRDKRAKRTHDAGVVLDRVPEGSSDIDYVQYNDVTDVYRVFLTGRANPDEPSRFADVRLAHLSDEEIAGGAKSHLKKDGSGGVLWLGSNFRIALLHGVVQQFMDLDTKQPVNVVVHTEKVVWTPFQAPHVVDGVDMYATPAYHYPPPFKETGALVGVGGFGPTKEAAADSYRRANGALPQPVKLKNEGYMLGSEAAKNPRIAMGRTGADQVPASTMQKKVLTAIPGTPGAAHLDAIAAKEAVAAHEAAAAAPVPTAPLKPKTQPKPNPKKTR
jgi:hypothetical protein